jgi:hypothetical protein
MPCHWLALQEFIGIVFVAARNVAAAGTVNYATAKGRALTSAHNHG